MASRSENPSYMRAIQDHIIGWAPIWKVLRTLALSPLLGSLLTGLLHVVICAATEMSALFTLPETEKRQNPIVRAALILTCTSVKFSHGCNDYHKDVGPDSNAACHNHSMYILRLELN